jgi:hypothetical protein
MVDLITFSEDIPHVEAAAKVQMDHLTSELTKMRAHLTQVRENAHRTTHTTHTQHGP